MKPADGIATRFSALAAWLVRDPRLRAVLSNSSLLTIGLGAVAASNIVTLTIIARTLGPETLSIIVLVVAHVGVMERLCATEVWQTFVKFGADARERDDDDALARLAGFCFSFEIVAVLATVALSLTLAKPVAAALGWPNEVAALVPAYAWHCLVNFINTPIGVLRSFGLFRTLAVIDIASAVVKVVLVVAAVLADAPLVAYVVALAAATGLRGLLMLIASLRALNRQNAAPRFAGLAQTTRTPRLMSFTFSCYATSVSTLPINFLDVVVVSKTLGASAVGGYRLMLQVTQLFDRLINPIYQAIYPELAAMVARDGLKPALRLGAKSIVGLTAVVAVLAAALAFTTEIWIPLLFGAAFSFLIVPTKVLFAVKTLVAMNAIVDALCLASGRAWLRTAASATSNLAFVVALYVFSDRFGLIGAASAFGVYVLCDVAIKSVGIWLAARRADEGTPSPKSATPHAD
ncbi:MAG: oligosaccharide flippase family protein [Pseudomonadota bacterium]